MAVSFVKTNQKVIADGIATVGTVTSTPVNLPAISTTQRVSIMVRLTVGSLTSVALTPQVTFDGSTWYDVVASKQTLTATENVSIPVDATGCKQLRLSVTAAGTATGSSIGVDINVQSG